MNRNGDLSNDPVAVALVHLDVFSKQPEKPEEPDSLRSKISRLLHPVEEPDPEVDLMTVAALWRWSQRNNVTLEAFGTGMDDRDVEERVAALEKHLALPFRGSRAWPSAAHLATELPFRRDLVGVMDVPERGLSYGSWWIEPASLF